jgi:acetoin utilization deacetylase AcuC-like enzyme
VSGLIDHLHRIKARPATEEELLTFHTAAYVARIKQESSERGGDGGDVCQFGHGSFEIAMLSAGGVLSGIEAIARGEVRNCYALVRPPGHHACADRGMGFCLFNNVVIGALRARALGFTRIAIVDYDVHHGNGTQEAFWNDPLTLFISVHQDSNYPLRSGYATETGGQLAPETTIKYE